MKRIILILGGVILLPILIVLLMAIFRICPPIESGPQPPWCVNDIRFEQDMNAIPAFLRSVKKEASNVKFKEEDPYLSSDFQKLNYLPGGIGGNAVKGDYKIDMGIGPMDFYWSVCIEEKCIKPREHLVSTISRAESLGSDFMYFTDYARINGDLEIYSDFTTLTEKEIEEKITYAEKYNQYSIFVVNLFVSDDTIRHSESIGYTKDRMYSDITANLLDNYNPNKEKLNKMFNEWESYIVKRAVDLGETDYLVLNPADFPLIFENEVELQNQRYKELTSKVKKVYDGKVCFMLEADYVEEHNIDFYEDADCVIVGMNSLEKILEGAQENVESVQTKWDEFFENEIFNIEKEIFIDLMILSYDGMMKEGWFEVGDYDLLNLDYEKDYTEQAIVYEAFFRSLYDNKVSIKGVYSYGYYWNDLTYPEDIYRIELTHSIRKKDAEHVYYKWAELIS